MKQLRNRPSPLTKDTLENDAAHRLRMVKFHESGVTIQLQDDWEYYLPPLITNKKRLQAVLGQYYRKYLLSYIRLDSSNLFSCMKEALQKTLRKRKMSFSKNASLEEIIEWIETKGFDIGFFISHANSLFADHRNHQLLYKLEHILRTRKNIYVHFFTEIDITNPSYNHLTDKCSSLLTHTTLYPLYSEQDTREFIAFLSAKWRLSLKKNQVEEILHQTGGYLWLVSHLVRFLRDHPDAPLSLSYEDDVLKKKLDIIWGKCTKKEQDVLKHAHEHMLTDEEKTSHEFLYLQKIHAISHEGTLAIPLLAITIQREKSVMTLHLKGNGIFHNDQDITQYLTGSEKTILKKLIAQKKTITTRETIAQDLWGKQWQENYSDWAIDRLLSRLRKKIKTLGIDPGIIQTVKGKGILFG